MDWFIGIWPLLQAYGGSALALTLCGVVIALRPELWKPASIAAALIATNTFFFAWGAHLEHKRDAARWEASINEEIKNADKDRTAADRDVERSGALGLRNDPFNRDNRPVNQPSKVKGRKVR